MSAATAALTLLRDEGVAHTVRSYPHDPGAESYGMEAAEKLGVEPDRVFKTLVTKVDGMATVAVVPVTTQLDLKSLARVVGGKHAQMADPAVAARLTGYVVGGISPLGQKRQLATVIDDSALLWDTVLVSAGRRGVDVELAPEDLIRLTHATVADISSHH
jgi:Cys-tRNA(Pro)/Cys-tRNA(Cys) deacylase